MSLPCSASPFNSRTNCIVSSMAIRLHHDGCDQMADEIHVESVGFSFVVIMGAFIGSNEPQIKTSNYLLLTVHLSINAQQLLTQRLTAVTFRFSAQNIWLSLYQTHFARNSHPTNNTVLIQLMLIKEACCWTTLLPSDWFREVTNNRVEKLRVEITVKEPKPGLWRSTVRIENRGRTI